MVHPKIATRPPHRTLHWDAQQGRVQPQALLFWVTALVKAMLLSFLNEFIWPGGVKM